MAKRPKILTTLRLSPDARALLLLLAERLDMTQGEVVGGALRELARRRKVMTEPTEPKGTDE